MLKLGVNPILVWNGNCMELTGFKEELLGLIYTIEGNDNYGEMFTLAVEKTFLDLLKQVD